VSTLAEPRLRRERPSLRSARATPRSHLVVERVIGLLSFASIFAIVGIFAFVLREALPLVVERGAGLVDMVRAQAWPGYDAPAHVWQPVGFPAKFGVVPLVWGTLKITGLALLVALPVGLGAAIWVSEIAPSRAREIVKPAIELLAGVPSVVIGVLCTVFVADGVSWALRPTYRLNALVAALGLAVTLVPVVFTVSEDALRTVPRGLREASAALGAERWQTTLRVVVPAALPGIWAAFVLASGRAIGETMIVLMASGNAAVLDASPTSSARTITATIASELGETARGSEHFRVLFLLGAVLFLITLAFDQLGVRTKRWLARRLGNEEAP
jgi:phosphate transport system permease protein